MRQHEKEKIATKRERVRENKRDNCVTIWREREKILRSVAWGNKDMLCVRETKNVCACAWVCV